MEIENVLTESVAGNVNTDYVVPANQIRKALYGQIVLTTDATVANRRVIAQILDSGSNVIADFHTGAVVAASQTDLHHEFMQGIFRETSFVGDAIQIPIPFEAWMKPGWKFRITIENGVAGDSYDVHFVFQRDH